MGSKRFFDIDTELEKIEDKSVTEQKKYLNRLIAESSVESFQRYVSRWIRGIVRQSDISLNDIHFSVLDTDGVLCIVVVYTGDSVHDETILNGLIQRVQSSPLKLVIAEVVLNGNAIFVKKEK